MNHNVAACILAKNWNASTKRAIDSALKFELPVYLGLTHDPINACEHSNIHVFSVDWEGDFAKARNSFLDKVTQQFILWIDSDEELFSFPHSDWDTIKENILFHRMKYTSQLTPRLGAQMHRNSPGIFWKRKIHEYITTADEALFCTRFFSNIIIRHHGYENHALVLQKHDRNLEIAESSPPEERAYIENLVRLRTAVANGKPNFFEWIDCYNEAKLTTNLHRVHSHCEYEPAIILCMAGFAQPAEECAKINPINILIQLALLTHEYLYLNNINASRLEFIAVCVTQGLYDPYEYFPHLLLGAHEQKILDYVKSWAAEWKNSVVNQIDFSPHPPIQFEDHDCFTQCESISIKNFNDNLLIMHTDTKKVVVLNKTSSILWGLLATPISWRTILDILKQAFPLESNEAIISSAQAFLRQLLSMNLITPNTAIECTL